MPSTRAERIRTYVRASAPWRKLLPHRTVRRRVQGVELYLPWSHLLPDYARSRPTYGQNLVDLAAALRRRRPDDAFAVLDIGSNVGDSALQIMARTGARVLCVEGDPYWARYLRMNVGTHADAVIEEVLLIEDAKRWEAANPVRSHGTTHFVQATDAGTAMPAITVAELRRRHPEFGSLRLVKSDTDGFDPTLVPAVAAEWSQSGPVLFFEFDPILARGVDAREPNLVWEKLAALGYDRLAVWDNAGDPLGRLGIGQAAAEAANLEPRPVELGYYFWDVAACRSDDAEATAAFDELMPQPFDARGTRR